MAQLVIVYWRDIPAQVIAQKGRKRATRELSKRFIEAIDMAAMRSGARDSDTYLADWRKGAPTPCDEDLEAAAEAACQMVEDDYDNEQLKALITANGKSMASELA